VILADPEAIGWDPAQQRLGDAHLPRQMQLREEKLGQDPDSLKFTTMNITETGLDFPNFATMKLKIPKILVPSQQQTQIS
jgi:hypothetical protein